MEYIPKNNIICYERSELKTLFEAPMRQWIAQEVIKRKIEDVVRDRDKIIQLASEWRGLKDKEEIEVFSALYMFPLFYPPGARVCFKLKDAMDPRKTPIKSLDELKTSLKENDLSDFLLKMDDGFRDFQLKAYTEEMTSNAFLAFLKKKLEHYGNYMGDVNFIITLQTGGSIPKDFFHDIHEGLKTFGLKGEGHVLISYNEENKLDVMNTVYPTLGTTTIESERFASSI